MQTTQTSSLERRYIAEVWEEMEETAKEVGLNIFVQKNKSKCIKQKRRRT
jgi:predicted amino acid-binding ACT domain protein